MLNADNSILIMIDIQDKLTGMLSEENKSEAESKALKIIKASDILNIETIITEQYPKGLGATIEPVREYLKEKYQPYEKTSFSVLKDEKIKEKIKNSTKKQVVLFGIESHICVFQSAIELLESGYEVFVVYDISYSRNECEKKLAMENLRIKGIQTLSLETILFMWLQTAKNPKFKEVQALIK